MLWQTARREGEWPAVNGPDVLCSGGQAKPTVPLRSQRPASGPGYLAAGGPERRPRTRALAGHLVVILCVGARACEV